MYHYKGALYDNIYLANGYKKVKCLHSESISVERIQELHDVIFKAVYKDEGFREREANCFTLTDKGWVCWTWPKDKEFPYKE